MGTLCELLAGMSAMQGHSKYAAKDKDPTGELSHSGCGNRDAGCLPVFLTVSQKRIRYSRLAWYKDQPHR